MSALRVRMQQVARERGINQLLVERDYAQSYVLLGIAATTSLKDSLVFKGGTALKKVHFGNFRFSEDLDFSSTGAPQGGGLERAMRDVASAAEQAARRLSPVTFSAERYEEREPHPGGQEAFIVRVQFPWQRQPMVPIKIEITHDEPVLLDAPPAPIWHDYGEPFDVFVRTYCLEEICAEKLRSTRQTIAKLTTRGWARPRARDFYDLWRLVREPPGRIDWSRVTAILPPKCSHRRVAIASIDDVFEQVLLDAVRAAWERTLGPFIRDLPPVNLVLSETRERLEALLRL